MDTREKFDSIVADRSLHPRRRQARVNHLLLDKAEAGARLAKDIVAEAAAEVPVSYAANFLAGLPAHGEEKNLALRELVTRQPDWAASGARLVEFADNETFERLERYAVHGARGPGALSIVYELAQHFPDRMRQYRKEIAQYDVDDLLLPGAPDEWVKDLLTQYRRTEDASAAVRLSYVRTDAARDALVTLLNSAPSGKTGFFAALLESAGVFADSREASTYPGSYRGLLGDEAQSPHPMGGVPKGPVPMSVADKKTAERILELRRAELPFTAEGEFDPIFFWYEGSQLPGHVYVKLTDRGCEGLATPMGESKDTCELITAHGGAVLEPEHHPYGLGGAAVKGTARIQVGGYPHWRAPERFPRCGECGAGMKFIASVDSGITSFAQLTFSGILYAFWCERCNVTCTHSQL
jgi:hypothetical protein